MANSPPVIVTGATGWLGRRLVPALCAEYPDREVRCLVPPCEPRNRLWLEKPANLTMWCADITDRDLFRAFHYAEGATVFHCAGIIHARPKVLHRVNVDGTANVLTAAQNVGAARFIYVSSNSPCGFNESTLPLHYFDERSPVRPYLAYGRSKARAEWLVNGAPMDTIIVRPTWFYGPGQPARQTQFFMMVRDGKAPIIGNGCNSRSMTYIDNLVDALLLCAKRPVAGHTFWISDARPYTMWEIVGTIEDVLQKDFGIKCRGTRLKLPRIAGRIAQWVDAGMQAVGMYNQKVHVLGEMGESIACSVEKARRVLGWVPKVALREGMQKSVQDLLDRGVRL